jgi:hypothetical protein
MAREAIGLKAALLSMILLVLACPAKAQVLYGSLTGNVTDVSNAPVPGAKIEAANVGTGISTEGVSDVRGVYLINNLQPGIYRVTISAGGFATVVHEAVKLEANTQRRADVQLQVARVSQQITVTAPIEALQTDRTDVKSQLSSTQITSLPLGNDRNFQTLLEFVPGVARPFPNHSFASNPTQSLGFYVHGTSDTNSMTLVDGAQDSNWGSSGDNVVYVPPSEAIQDVNIVTSGYDAEQGSATGFVTNVTIKSGTNAFHGSAFEYNTLSALQSRNYFYYGPTIPKYVLNQFGISLGGPIKKNKLFFFGDWERYRMRQLGTAVTSVPTAAIRNGDFSTVSTKIYDPTTGNANGTGRIAFANNVIPPTQISSAAAKMAALIPLPNYGGAAAGIANNFQSIGDFVFNRDSVDLKINYLPTQKSTIFVRYSAEPTFIFNPQQLGAAGGNALGTISQPGNASALIQLPAVGGTYAFSPHLLLDANLGYTRYGNSLQNTDIGTNFGLVTLGIPGTNGPNPLQGGIPYFSLSGFSTLGNSSISNPSIYKNNLYFLAANLTWVRGSHSFRFGGTYGRYDQNNFNPGVQYSVRGGFNFTGGVTALSGGAAPNAYNAWGDFLLGLPQGMGKDIVYVYPTTLRESEYGLYARDNWQVTKKLSINYGVRYEVYPVATRDHEGPTNYDPTTNTVYVGGAGGVPRNAYIKTGAGQLFPRLGFAYRLNEKTVIRSGFGMSTDPFPFVLEPYMYPYLIGQMFSGANSYTPAGSLSNTWTGPTTNGATLPAGIPAFTPPSLAQGKYQLPTNLGDYFYSSDYRRGYTAAWSFTVQRALGKDFNAQVAFVGNHTVRQPAYVNYNAAGPGGGNAGTPLYAQFGNPNAIYNASPFSGGSYNGLETQLTRRVAGGEVGVVYTYSKTLDDNDNSNGSVMWAYAPYLHRNEALAGYDRTHIFQFYAVYGSPFGHGQHWMTHGPGAMILGGWSLSPILSRDSGTPFSVTTSGSSCNCPGNTQTADQVAPNVAILGGHGSNSPYFDPMAFAAVTAVRFGSTGRNIVRGPGYFNVDVSLARDFKLTERLKLQFRAEAYDLTNTPNFANPATTVSNAKFANGAVTSYGGYDIISSTLQVNGGPDRQIRFALKMVF